jgi:hypothetical protein
MKAVQRLAIAALITLGMLALAGCGSSVEDGKQTRLSNEQIGLRPPACMNEQPLRCEEEKAEAHQEEEGATHAEKQKEIEKRAQEEAEK